MPRAPLTRYDRETLIARNAAREASDQFQSLSREAQDELLARWNAELDRQILREDSGEGRLWHSIVSGALLFVFVTVVWDRPTPLTLSAAVVLGGLTGVLWHVVHAGRFRAMLCALPAYLALRVLGPTQSPFQMFFGFAAMAAFAAVCGTLREMHVGNLDPVRFAPWRRRS